MNKELSMIEVELQNKVRAFSNGKIKYLVSDELRWGVTYCLGEEGLDGWHLIDRLPDHIVEWCEKDTSDRIAANPEWFDRA